ncbi:ATP-binding cassette domain-containing protein [Bacillus solimangrovi]|uniref:ABC transmembrane type-1 domain-containing protein n=1 Tax=Bacillus solimangrovi TaxID=1305675 RepID=A0A1E5LD85_9BACI|nr:ATP-binding cassette domain-containing protein [Bacillus solimangrovi]OEH92057.1 hypothetical protein BFG57_16930 [Bacillus solimangrovi]
MVPSITTYTRKDGSKRKHRYYVCSNFHNKGYSACKANSIKAYDAEDTVINHLTEFLNDSACFNHTIENINKDTIHQNVKLKEQLENIEIELKEANALQEKYIEAFEQNLFPVSILQERLQKLAKSKNDLAQKKNELSVQLSSSDTKIIPPDVVRHLLEKYVQTFQQATREKKKQLFQLLLNKITIKQSDGRSRIVDKIELDFDFSEVNLSKTFTLIHILNLESDYSRKNPLQILIQKTIYHLISRFFFLYLWYGLLSFIILIVIVGIGAWRVSSGIITIGELAAFIIYLIQVVSPFFAMNMFVTNYQEARGSIKRVMEVLNEKDELEMNKSLKKDSFKHYDHDVCRLDFRNVSFSYDEHKKILDDISFSLETGKMIALVGPSGSGKSTIFNLLERFYHPENGDMTLNHQSYRTINISNWRKMFSFVPQDFPLLYGTIKDNLTYGLQRNISDERINRSNKKSKCS